MTQYCAKTFGLRSRAVTGELNDMARKQRPYYHKFKKRHGIKWDDPLPKWVMDSVQRLLDMGYSLSDIGAMIGVSRERVRQWAVEHNMRRPYNASGRGSAYRVWNDELNRFECITTAQMVLRRKRLRGVDRLVERRLTEIRLDHIICLRACARELGRVPTLTEFLAFLGWKLNRMSQLASFWQGRRRNEGYAMSPSRAVNILWGCAGFADRPRGHKLDPTGEKGVRQG